MKKSTFFIISAFVLALASCAKAPEKATVEAGFAPKGEIPSVNTPELVELFPVEKRATIKATFSNFSENTDSLELGFLVSTDRTFSSSKAVLLTGLPDGEATFDIPVTVGTTNWVVATASSIHGSTVSEVLEIVVPEVP